MRVAYRQGLHELGDGLHAYLQPDGGWGWSNAGLVSGSEESLLIDTLFDLTLTREMLEQMRPVTAELPIARAVNTHGNGDHWFGNQLLPEGIPIIASAEAIEDMRAAPPAAMAALLSLDLGPELGPYLQRIFGEFEFDNIEPRLPTESFRGEHRLGVAGREVELIKLGPAHTAGDTIVHVPDASTVFTGDLLFCEGTPIVWVGPLCNWIAACQRIRQLGARTLVPGHGPVTDESGLRDLERYLRYVEDEARKRFEAGLDAEAAADDIDISAFADWGEPERIAVNVVAAYRELDPSQRAESPPELLARMARWSARHGA